MYIFAEPVTEEQVAEIQSQNEAKIKEFERKILGLTSDEAMAQEIEEDDSKWENIQADVRETMDKDELSIDQSNGEEREYDESENSRVGSSGRGISGDGDLYATREEARGGDEVTASAADGEEDEVDEADELVDTEEDEGAEEHEGETLEESIDEADEEQDLDEEPPEESEEINKGYSEDVQEASEGEGQAELEGNDGEEEAREEGSTDVDQEDSQAEDHNTGAADKDHVDVQRNQELLTEKNEREHQLAGSGTHATPPTDQRKRDASEALADFPIEADKDFLAKVTEELSDTDAAASQNPDILAMTLTIRNKVNGKFVLRPECLTAGDNWSIEYSLTEVDTETRARALYKACQGRRKKKHDKMETKNDEERLTGFLRRLRELSMQGRKWRARQDKEDTKKPMRVLGDVIGERSGEGDGSEHKPDD